VLVSLESTAAKYLGLYGAAPDVMPRLSELARTGIVFDNAYAVYPESIKGLFSVLCSTYPSFDSPAEMYAAVPCPSIATALGGRGYATGLFHAGRFVYLGMEAIVRNRGYQRLEDLTLRELLSRIKNPNEYLGGGCGLATTTRIIKQADVAVMMHAFKNDYSQEVKRANWEYYEPRTEHGSSLSACIYALVAADIGKLDWAYGYFMKTATVDLSGDYKRFVGTLYIGGTHPAANGGAWMSAVLGFGGLNSDGDMLKINPSLPPRWSSIDYRVSFRGQDYRVEATHGEVKITASRDNTTAPRLEVAGKPLQIAAGGSETVRW